MRNVPKVTFFEVTKKCHHKRYLSLSESMPLFSEGIGSFLPPSRVACTSSKKQHMLRTGASSRRYGKKSISI